MANLNQWLVHIFVPMCIEVVLLGTRSNDFNHEKNAKRFHKNENKTISYTNLNFVVIG